MGEQPAVYDPATVDGRFQLEMLTLRWALIVVYAVLYYAGVLHAEPVWFLASEGFLIAYHVYYSWTVWYELTRHPLPEDAQYATPFLDTVAVSLGLIAVGDPLHPIWGVYLMITVAVAFFYYAIIRGFAIWLVANYALVGLTLQLREVNVPAPQMGVAMVIMLAALSNVAAFTGSERRLRARLGRVAETDPLTNLPNRRALEATLAERLDASADGSHGPAVLMIDIDRFKRYNDQYGHLVADGVLEQIGQLLATSIRDPDRVARYGGDEFVVVAANVTEDEAVLLAERLRNQIARTGLCTVSIGVATSGGAPADVEELLDLADAGLRVAKQSGRNQVQGPRRPASRAA